MSTVENIEDYYSFISVLFVAFIMGFISYFYDSLPSLDTYCVDHWWQYLEYSGKCFIDWEFYEYITDIEQYIFNKSLKN